VEGTLVAASRLELQATCYIEGEVHTRRMQLEEGAVLNGTVQMSAEPPTKSGASPAAEAEGASAPEAKGGAPDATREPATVAPSRS
jgi:cytoskeletal protein CcmA (bactofilin family)